MTITITHTCGCERTLPVKGIRESKQYQNWLATKECPDCHVSPELAAELEALADEAEAIQAKQPVRVEVAPAVYWDEVDDPFLHPELDARERTNSRGQTYPQWFDNDGKMVGCGCDEAKAVTVEKYNFKPCHHRTNHNAALEAITGEDLAAHVEDELRRDAERTAYNYFCLAMNI